MVWQIVSLLLGAGVVCLLVRLWGIRKSLGEIADGLEEKLREDTNTPLTVTSSDPAVQRLAVELNEELHALRRERHRLQQGNHELQGAITNIAHDLRTPLTAISGYLELLEQEKLAEKPAAYTAVLRERTERLKELTEELFRFSLIDNEAEELKAESLSLRAALEIALAAAYQPLVERGITPAVSLPAEKVIRELDANALQRILSNILMNGAKYAEGSLSVSLDTEGTITFANPAPALSEVQVGRLFDRFYTVESGRSSTGLGLSIAKLLTERMGGSIRAEYAEGIFTVILKFPDGGMEPDSRGKARLP